ncbi:MAG: DUF2325 domain-containing protein [Rhodospirillales bacterium]|nr:DUF2325 domain-containing protein [Rhodospirillales bacterium]
MCSQIIDYGFPSGEGRRRKKLWELDKRLHCSIIGTCLSMGDLRVIERRLSIAPLKGTSDFQIHGNFVVWAANPGPAAKHMHKMLDRRYGVAIRRFASISTPDELTRLWDKCLEEADIPGPYWALVSHPESTIEIIMPAFGQVHMLSHLVGAANRADIRRLSTLQDERDELEQNVRDAKRRLAEQDRHHRAMLYAHAAELQKLSEHVAATAPLKQQLEAAEYRVAELEQGVIIRSLRAETIAGRGDLKRAKQLARELTNRLEVSADENTALRKKLQDELSEKEAIMLECEALESVLRDQIDSGDCSERRSECLNSGLQGRRIVYIGGRNTMIPHLRTLVERSGAIFLHHDGGLEEQTKRLDRLLSQCDAVFCPVDCVSHDACLRAKRKCKQRATEFVPLRSSGLSSFVAGLRQLSQTLAAGQSALP